MISVRPHVRVLRTVILASALAGGAVAVGAQRPAFDVASIKLSGDKTPAATRVTPSGMSYTGASLRTLIADAHGVKALSLTTPDAKAKDVLDDRQRYDIEAKTDHPATPAQLMVMLQTLLSERFKLALHHDSKVESVYRLTALPAGIKLQASTGDGDATCAPAPNGGAVCRHMTMAAFSDYLTSHLSRVVLDGTKLDEAYDFTLNLQGTPGINQLREAIASGTDPGAAKTAWAAAMNDWTGSSIFTDIQKQLGLKLDADKAPVDNLVIDHLEKPTPNVAPAPGR